MSSIVVHRFSGSLRPSAVAKLACTTESDVDAVNEAAILDRLGPVARAAGACVPRVISRGQQGTHPLFLQSVVDGKSAAALLTAKPIKLLDVMERVTDWLESWGVSTWVTQPIGQAVLEQAVLKPAARLVRLLPLARGYLDWLAQQCEMLSAPVPLVAAHGDLTMWNLLIDHASRLGVVDWSEAREHALPLTDFFYAMADAVAVAHGWSWARACETCFTPRGVYAHHVRALLQRLSRALHLSGVVSEVCLHACFLGHAVNEQLRGESGSPKAFLPVVEWLALNREAVGTWIGEWS